MSSRDRAVQLLDHYVTLVMARAGIRPDSDTHAELAELVDAIIDASVQAVQEETRRRLRSAGLKP